MIPLATRTTHLKPTAVNAILGEMRQLQTQGRDIVSLMRGEPDFATPEHVAAAAQEAIRGGRTRYPDNRGERIGNAPAKCMDRYWDDHAHC